MLLGLAGVFWELFAGLLVRVVEVLHVCGCASVMVDVGIGSIGISIGVVALFEEK